MKYSVICLIFLFSLSAFANPIPVGSNNNGTLLNAMALPESGEGYVHMYHEEERFYATQEMISMIQKTAFQMNQKYPEQDRLQVEDLSAVSGGDIDGHASHENGLDADMGYYKTDRIEHDPVLRNKKYADPMVVNGKVIPNFDRERNWELMKAMHQNGDVQKIFVDVAIKNELCRYARKVREFDNNIHVLRSLRHQANHQDHLHVRLRCPKEAKKCINLEEAPKGSGCP